jgi:hypothetical protein
MTDPVKKKYHDMNEKDKVRFENEVTQLKTKGFFVNKEGVKSTDMLPELKKFPKDTVMPKHVMSPFNCFNSMEHADIAAKFPNIPLTQLMKKKAELWKSLSEKQLKKYEDASKKDHERREKEILHLRQHGFFVDKNGVKSTDLKKKVSREEAKKATASKKD